ncbi:SurA N-terminal domain-containing protein [Brevibacillus migulae]|uniref:SurA N-terminal domain-containing protein n=1 Tax=Brevibacillus migulae TaxID=1644114 RepID=UPI00106E87FD|nr:SurA N-terminal domain-containing protein [Brevibacillus migulae]
MKKFDASAIAISILVLALVVLGVTQQGQAHDPEVAKIGKTAITQSQFSQALETQYGKRVMSQLVAEELVRLEAQKQGVKASEEEVEKTVAGLKSQGTPEQFQKFLEEQKMTEEQLREQIALQLTRDQLLDKAYPVKEEEIKEYYDKNKKKLGEPTPTLEQATPQIKEKLANKHREKYYKFWLGDLEQKYQVEYANPDYAIVGKSEEKDTKK